MIDLGSIGKALVDVGLPVLGGLLPIPGGAAFGAALAGHLTGAQDAKTEDVLAALANPEGALRAKEFYYQHEQEILRIQVNAEMVAAQAVNQTMQVEAASEYWLTANWRGLDGVLLGVSVTTTVAVVLIAYCGVIFYGVDPEVLSYIPSMLGAVSTVLGVLAAVVGIHNFFHGKALADPSNTAVTKG